MSTEKALSWRQRLVQIRGIALTALALLFLLLSRQMAIGLPDILVAMLLGLLALPSLLFFATRGLAEQWQAPLLTLDLLLDVSLFLVFLVWAGGVSNPLAFYLLLPILLAALSCHWWLAALLVSVSSVTMLAAWSAPHAALPGTAARAMTHMVDPLHALGMWLIFVVLGLVLTVLGASLRREKAGREAWARSRLEIALQRERMYDTAATQAHLAHEINTPLASLIWTIEDLRAQPAQPEQQPLLAQLADCSHRISHALRHGADADAPVSPCSLDQMVHWIGQRIALLNPSLTVTLAQDSPRPPLTDTANWSRILLNLAYNANDAGATRLLIQCQMRDQHWILQVSDNGPACHPDDAARGGMGIGLALVETALTRFRGQLQRLGNGPWTVVTMTLPDREGLQQDD